MTVRLASCLLAIAATLAACSSVDMAPRARKADLIARDAGWSGRTIAAGSFDLASFSSPPSSSVQETLTVYIEGDGLAFLDRVTASADPTPTDPLALRLAIAGPQRPSAYLARPCQYALPDHGRNCGPALWTSRRYAPEVIDSLDRAVEVLKGSAGARRLVLVGYSGGGAVAALLAARRSDVAGLVTVAANLDVGYWVKRDGLEPLTGSLDPVAFATRLATVPQVHFVGGRDQVVGADVVRSYIARLPAPHRAALVEIADYDHRCCWADTWRELLARPELAAIAGWH
jgi:pimeloyl-ACP methyl ester carboxylesterase